MPEITYLKLAIAPEILLNKEQQLAVEATLKNASQRLIFEKLKPTKNDYIDQYSRGSVEFNNSHRNYCFSKVAIPDGSIVAGCNFSQRKPKTVAITGINIKFIGCNLTNNVIDKSWDVSESCYGEIDFEAIEAKEVLSKEVVGKEII